MFVLLVVLFCVFCVVFVAGWGIVPLLFSVRPCSLLATVLPVVSGHVLSLFCPWLADCPLFAGCSALVVLFVVFSFLSFFLLVVVLLVLFCFVCGAVLRLFWFCGFVLVCFSGAGGAVVVFCLVVVVGFLLFLFSGGACCGVVFWFVFFLWLVVVPLCFFVWLFLFLEMV